MEYNSFFDVRDQCRKALTEYTLKAYHCLPEIENPVILDIGCGTGVGTIELAKLSGGNITGIDIDDNALKILKEKCFSLGISNIEIKNMSLFSIEFPENYFDIVWVEGSIAFIGFEKGIQQWGKLIKSNGYMVIHDDIIDLDLKFNLIKKHGYKLLDHFTLSEKIWGEKYYVLLKKLTQDYLDQKNKKDAAVKAALNEIKMYNTSPKLFQSVAFILQKMS